MSSYLVFTFYILSFHIWSVFHTKFPYICFYIFGKRCFYPCGLMHVQNFVFFWNLFIFAFNAFLPTQLIFRKVAVNTFILRLTLNPDASLIFRVSGLMRRNNQLCVAGMGAMALFQQSGSKEEQSESGDQNGGNEDSNSGSIILRTGGHQLRVFQVNHSFYFYYIVCVLCLKYSLDEST